MTFDDEDSSLEELDDFAELLLDLALLLDLTLEEDDFTELLDASSQSSQMLEDESSEGRVEKLLSSSPQAARNATANTNGTKPAIFFIKDSYP